MSKPIFFSLVVLNIVLLVSNGFLTAALKNAGATSRHELDLARRERTSLSAERTRMELIVRTLKDTASDLSRLRSAPQAPQLGASEQNTQAAETPVEPRSDRLARVLLAEGIEKPDPSTIPLMTAEEKEELRAMLKSLPKLSEDLLLQGDIDRILEDPGWNPEGRELTEAERRELSRRVGEYRYYAKWSAVDRYKTYVEGELPRLREQGNFVEYPEGDPPVVVDEASYVHADHTGDPGTVQYYYFFPDEYPELEHHRLVERERLADSYVRVYELISDPDTETETQKE